GAAGVPRAPHPVPEPPTMTRLLVAAALFAAGALANAKDPSEWSQFVHEYEEAYFVADPDFAVVQGRHEFDGKLPDWSAPALARHAAWLHAQQKVAQAFK